MSTITDPKEKVSAAIGALIFFAPHFMDKKTEFVVFYMRQSFGIFLLQIILGVIGIIPLVGLVAYIASLLILLATFFLAYKAYSGEKFEIPYLLKYSDLVISKLSFLKDLFTAKN